MSSVGTWLPSHAREIRLPSNLVNVGNFVIFDIVLVSLVFYFTTEISGRLNYLDLYDGSRKKLRISCPAIVGGGLCSTNARRTYFLIFVRVLALALILASNLAVDGSTRRDILTRTRMRRIPGSVDNKNRTEFKNLMDIARSCATSDGAFVYYGELRENDLCEYNRRLLTKPISIGLSQLAPTLTVRNSTWVEQRPASKGKFPIGIYRAANARIQCIVDMRRPPGQRLNGRNCRGVIVDKGTTYVCETFTKREGDDWTGNCREIRNFDVTNEHWTQGLFLFATTVTEHIIGTSIAAEGNVPMKYFGPDREVTQIHHAWFALLGTKVLLVIVLACFTGYLMRVGAKCVVHDERSLASLLTSTVSRQGTYIDEDALVYLNARAIGEKTVFWVSKYPMRKRPNEAKHILEEEAA